MNAEIYSPLFISLKVALGATLAIIPPGMAAAYLLARRDFFGKSLLETLLSLPLVLPPTAVGYLLLRMLGSRGILGRETLGFDPDILLTWKGALIAGGTMAFPLLVRTAKVAFSDVDSRLENMARTLGMNRFEVFARITLPLAGRGLLAAIVLAFSRALGEFGATVIVAGNIPGKTQTLALAIYNHIQVGREAEATRLLLITVFIAFILVWCVELLTRRAHSNRQAEDESRPS